MSINVTAHKSTVRPCQSRMMNPKKPRKVTAVERLYLLRKAERSSPPPEPPKPQTPPPEPPLKLTREDLEQIVNNKRTATIDQLEWLLQHSDDPRLQISSVDIFHLRNLAASALAERHVAHLRNGVVDPSEEFAFRVLGQYPTPYGTLTAEEVQRLESIRMAATAAIQKCEEHKRERCRCWNDAREQLYNIRRDFGEKSALGMSALAVWNSVESLARSHSNRPEQPPVILNLSPQAAADMLGRPVPNPYNWRYYKSDTYRTFLGSQ